MNLLSSLTNRIFLAGAALVVVSIVVAVYRVDVTVTAQAEDDLHAGLREAASLVDEHGRAQFDQFRREARLVADLPVLKNAVSTDDAPTVQPIAEEYGREIRADALIVTNRTGRVLAHTGEIAPTGTILAAAPANGDVGFLSYPGGILEIAAIPIEPGPATLGALIVAFSLDRAAAQGIKALTDSDIALVADGHVVASTLSPEQVTALEPFVGRAGLVDHIPLAGDDYIGSAQPLGSRVNTPHAPTAIVLRSRTDRLRFLRTLQREIVVTGAAAVLLATLIAYLIARTVTRPLRALTATMGEIAATGDLASVIPAGGVWDDEDARVLAATFRRLTAALDQFQREAAQRERLSSLGRLSTVIAHEVRNPLMIIKAAVHGLRRQPSVAVREAAESIEEEVARLNHVVTDVLDFAKPIRVDLAPADLLAICRAAAQAVHATAGGMPVTISCPESEAPLVTDAERVRAVLVNLLTNADAAAQAAHATTDAPAPVTVRVWASTAGWEVEVRDCGVGIAAEHLARIFEPFFTTRRTGSGLGLAISRNIVSALGGTLTAESQMGAGTTVRLTLPNQRHYPEVP